MTIINKDITEATEPIIIHQVNCMNAMGSGVAKALYTKWLKVKTEYHTYCTQFGRESITDLIGSINVVSVEPGRIVVNCYSQLTYGNDGTQHTNYDAVRKCFNEVSTLFPDDNVAIPYNYGCGLGGGDWAVVSALIEEIFGDRAVVYKI